MDLSLASIHPCKHAAVMKRIMEKMSEGGRELRVDQCVLLHCFLQRAMAWMCC